MSLFPLNPSFGKNNCSLQSGVREAVCDAVAVNGTVTAEWMMIRRIPWSLGLVVLALAACGKESGTDPDPLPGEPTTLVVTGGGQTGVVGAPLPQPVAVKVLDAGGTPMPGVTVTFAVSAGGGSLSRLSATTGADGIATVSWTLGTVAGGQQATAQAGSRLATITATATPAAAAEVRIAPDSLFLAQWGETGQFTANVFDQYGNAISGTALQWSSSDTAVAVVSNGAATSVRAGRSILTARTPSGITGTRPVIVALQLNAACVIPGAPVVPAAAGALPVFSAVSNPVSGAALVPGLAPDAVVLDYDGDTYQDIVVMQYPFPPTPAGSGRIFVWRNDRSGRFVDVTSTALVGTVPAPEHPRQYEVADFNRDGRSDFYAAQHGYDADPFPGAPNLLFLTEGSGALRNVGASNLQPNATDSYTHGSASGDVDCDGDVDIFEFNILPRPHANLQINAGSGTFAAQNTRLPADMASGSTHYTSAVACDFDRDGDPDLFVGGWTTGDNVQRGRDRLLINDGFGRYRYAPITAVPAAHYAAPTTVDARCADINRDGWQDLLIASTNNYASGHFDIWLNNRDMTFRNATASLAPNAFPANGWIFRVFPADFNADGWIDLLVTGSGPNPVTKAYINRGATTAFIEHSFSFPGFGNYPIDADRDGKTDVIQLAPGAPGSASLWRSQ